MIVYQLACDEGHFFEGWFASAEACETQAAAGHLACPACASVRIRKLPSAPYVKGASDASEPPVQDAALRRKAVLALRRFILSNTENVGSRFAEVARRIHYGEEEARGIRGKVTVVEAVELMEEGVAALPISPEIIPSEEVH